MYQIKLETSNLFAARESLLLVAETWQSTESGADLVEFVLDNFYVIVDALESSDVSFWN